MTRGALLGTALALAACTSTHDLGEGPSALGGGVYRETVQPGLHYIVVKSNVAPWTNQDAIAQQWQREADRFCGAGRHQDLRVEDLVDDEGARHAWFVSVPYLITVRRGYALCASASLSTEQALRLIDARR
jgi:hypothetical protein